MCLAMYNLFSVTLLWPIVALLLMYQTMTKTIKSLYFSVYCLVYLVKRIQIILVEDVYFFIRMLYMSYFLACTARCVIHENNVSCNLIPLHIHTWFALFNPFVIMVRPYLLIMKKRTTVFKFTRTMQQYFEVGHFGLLNAVSCSLFLMCRNMN